MHELSHCAWTTLRRGLSTAVGDSQAVPGAIIARATAGELANPHPHLHAIVSCGAWADGGRGDCLRAWPSHLTGEQLEMLFRREVLALLVKREHLAQGTAEKLMQWSPSGFSVWLGDPIEPHEVESRLRLARYIVKSPVALDRMEYDAKSCMVAYRSVSQGRSRTITALDFMADLSVHIPNPGEHNVRPPFGRCPCNRAAGAIVSYLGRCSPREISDPHVARAA